MPRWTRALAVGAVAGLLGVVVALTPLGLTLERSVGLGALYLLRGPIEPPDEVVVVGMDRESARRLDLPPPPRPWPRTVHARLIEALAGRGAAVSVLDLRLDLPADEAGADAALADAMAAAGRVVLFEHLERTRQAVGDPAGGAAGHLTMDRLVPPLPAFAEAAAGLGPFPLPKVPARVDRFWTFSSVAGDVPTLPSVALLLDALEAYEPLLALLRRVGMPGVDGLPPTRADLAGAEGLRRLGETLRTALTADPALRTDLSAAVASAAGLTEAERRRLRALIDLHGGPGSRYLNLYGPPGTLPTIPYAAVLAGAEGGHGAMPDLAGKVVFVGLSDLSGTETKDDGFPTVFSRADGVDLSGVEIGATAFANLLDGRSLRPTDAPTTAGLLLAVGAVAAVGARTLPALPAVLATLLLGALYLIGAHLAFSHADLWPPLAIPLLLQLPLALGWGLVDRYRQVSRERRNIDRGARMYLPARLVQELSTEITDPRARDETVYSVCMLSDIERYTALAESMPPAELAALMSAYFQAVLEPIERHGGVISDMIGDGALCVWTAPAPDPAVRAQACAAAVEVTLAVERFNRDHAPHRLPTRIGLNADWAVLGHIGGSGHFAYGVVGDVVNTASRVEGLNKQLGTRLLAAGPAVEGVDGLLLRPLGRFRLVGKSAPLPVVEVLGYAAAADPARRDLCARFGHALDAFAAQRWGEAAELFEVVLALYPDDGPTGFFLDRCRRYKVIEPSWADPTVIQLATK